jgi:hypothetical protein
MASTRDFLVRKDDVRSTQWATTEVPALTDGQALLRVDKFALTANNITYAVMGAAMRYWNFFPAADAAWGRVPVWGFADVVESRAAGVEAGQRYWGYYPMSMHLVVQPARVSDAGFVDRAGHRAGLPPTYNQYLRASAATGFAPETEAAQAVLRPLFMTSFLIDDFISDNDFFGARSVLIVSASSKTGLGLAFALARRNKSAKAPVEVVAVTSPRSEAFIKALGIYDRILFYDDIARMPIQPSIMVDMAGSEPQRRALHERLQADLKYDCAVGATHWTDDRTAAPMPGPAPALFFAPDVARKRAADWGPGGLEDRYTPVWADFLTDSKRWLEISEAKGEAAVERAYRDVADGKAPPQSGYVLSVA